MVNKIRKYIRKFIFPTDEILKLIADLRLQRVLDVGAGTGMFLELLDNANLTEEGIGVEVSPQYYRKVSSRTQIIPKEQLRGTFDLIVFNDVLHHVKDKQEFLNYYISKHLKPSGYVLVKDMRKEVTLYKYFNRFHDLVFAGELIDEISENELQETLKPNLNIIQSGTRRIFLYDHYFILFKNNNQNVHT